MKYVVLPEGIAPLSGKMSYLPTYQQNLVIYQYQCQCQTDYIVKIIQRFELSIVQRAPGQIRRHVPVISGHSQSHELTIAEHLLNSVVYRTGYSGGYFSVLHRALTRLHFNILETVFINIQRPTLCMQRKCVHQLTIFGESKAKWRENI